MSKPIIIIGSGGHARVLADTAEAAGIEIIGFTDADPNLHGGKMFGYPILGNDIVLERYDHSKIHLVNGLGSVSAATRQLRRQVQEALEARGWAFASVIHPMATVSRHATLGPAVQISAGAIIQPCSVIGKGTIVNTSAVIEHDAKIGPWCHLAPGVVVCGDTEIGEEGLIGTGAVLRHGLRLGPRVTVGAGAAVISDFAADEIVIGVPARPKEQSR